MKKLFNKFKNSRIMIIGMIILLVVSATIIASVFKNSFALENDYYSVGEPQYNGDVTVDISLLKQSTVTAFYYSVDYNITDLDSRVSYIKYDVKASKFATPINEGKMDLSMGNNVLINTSSLGNKIAIYKLTVSFFDSSDNKLDLTNLDLEGVITVKVTEVNTSATFFRSVRWEAPASGTYSFELWGAEGNWYPEFNKGNAGAGAYTKGTIYLKKGEVLYVYVGENKTLDGDYYTPVYNGGSRTLPYDGGHAMSSGGGATDIRYFGSRVPTATELEWNNPLGLRSRIMVAGAGGGTLEQETANFKQTGKGGAGGGLKGYPSVANYTRKSTGENFDWPTGFQTGGSQVSGGQGGGLCQNNAASGKFGVGGNGGMGEMPTYPEVCQQTTVTDGASHTLYPLSIIALGNIGGGGGGGYYGGGGGGGINDCHNGGAGGSSFISGYQGAIAVDSSGNPICTEAQAKTNANCSKHYSNLVFDDTEMIDGKGYVWNNEKAVSQKQMPNPQGGYYPLGEGKTGTGAARITLVLEDDVPEEIAAKVTLIKYEKSVTGTELTSTISGAKFGLYSNEGGGAGSLLESYTTDSEGKLEITDLPKNKTYYLQELVAPEGYLLDTTKYEITTGDTEIVKKAYNQRKPGSVNVKKINDSTPQRLLEGAKFELYKDGDATVLGTYTTSSLGVFNISGLEWGRYYLKEIEAPVGYELDSTLHYFNVNSSTAGKTINLTIVNAEKKGTVVLTKHDEAGTIELPDAEFALYKSDGTVVRTGLVTESDGTFKIKDIPWGSYYLQETKAPLGYGLTTEKIIFTVSISNCDIVQYLDAYDPVLEKEIVVTKRLKISDIVFDHGRPSFIFKVMGEDIHGTERILYKEIVITEVDLVNYLKANPGAEYIEKTETFILTAGIYDVSELDTVRYELDSITNVTNGVINDEKVTFDLTTEEAGAAKFYNKKIDQTDTNHTASIVNVIKAKTKLTAITADYSGSELVYGGSYINKNNLKVTAFYDDGSSEILANDDYDLVPDQVPTFQYGPTALYVVYTEGGVTRTAGFVVDVVQYTSLKATYNSSDPIGPGATVNRSLITVKAVYSNGDEKTLQNSAYQLSISNDRVPTGATNPLSVTVTYVEYGVTHTATISIPIQNIIYYWNGGVHQETGGWAWVRNDYGTTPGSGSLTVSGSNIILKSGQGTLGRANNRINFTNIATLSFTYNCPDGVIPYTQLWIMISDVSDGYGMKGYNENNTLAKSTDITSLSGTKTLNVSSITGLHYLYLGVANAGDCRVTQIVGRP